MKNKENDKEIVYQVSFDPYKIAEKDKESKKIFIDDKFIALSVGSQVHFGESFKSTLLIDVHYDSDTKETLTEQIPQLESFGSVVAINPNFKDEKLINKLKELDIISDTNEKVNYENKNYELVKVNLEELSKYKPFGDTVLKDYISIEKHRESIKGKEIE